MNLELITELADSIAKESALVYTRNNWITGNELIDFERIVRRVVKQKLQEALNIYEPTE